MKIWKLNDLFTVSFYARIVRSSAAHQKQLDKILFRLVSLKQKLQLLMAILHNQRFRCFSSLILFFISQ